MNLIDNYMETLTRLLTLRLPQPQVQDRAAEIRTHLEMDAQERMDAGANATDAELAACKTVGSPQVVARQIVRQARGYASAPAWRLVWPCGIALVLALVIPYSLLGHPSWFAVADTGVRWAPFLVMVFFGIRVVQTRRWLVRPMMLWAAIASAGIVAGSMLITPPPPSAAAVAQSRVAIQNAIVQVQGEQALVEQWQSGHIPTDRAPLPMGSVETRSTVLPFVPVTIRNSEDSVSLEASDSATDAAKRWATYGTAYANDVRWRLGNLHDALNIGNGPRLAPNAIAWNCFKLAIGFTLYQLLVLVIVNGSLLGLVRLQQARRNRREPLFA